MTENDARRVAVSAAFDVVAAIGRHEVRFSPAALLVLTKALRDFLDSAEAADLACGQGASPNVSQT